MNGMAECLQNQINSHAELIAKNVLGSLLTEDRYKKEDAAWE